jgi:hypothetical protein
MKIPILDIVIDDDKFRLIYMIFMMSSMLYIMSTVDSNAGALEFVLYRDMLQQQQRMMVS